MKKTLMTLAVGCMALVSARDIPVQLEQAKLGADVIPGWTFNKSVKAFQGKGEIVIGSEADEKAFHVVTPAGKSTAYYMQAGVPVKVGEYLEISADVKGKGSITFSYYTYTDKDGFLSGVKAESKTINLTGNWKEIKFKLKINPSTQGVVSRIRPCFTVAPGSEVWIEDLELEIDDDRF